MNRRAFLFMLAACAASGHAANWSDPVEIRYESERCVTYRARLAGDYLVVQATHDPPWHTYAMDNKQRAKIKLAGKQSLGIDAPTEIKVSDGLAVVGPWYQTRPNDYSKPELRWFTWGFEGESMFVAKVRRSGPGLARISIRGQACKENTCKQIETEIPLPLARRGSSREIDFRSLVRVR